MTARSLLVATVLGGAVLAAQGARPAPPGWRWTRLVSTAPYAGSYNYPVYTVRGESWSMHPRGSWRSRDGVHWTATALPASGLNSAYQRFVLFNDAVMALGSLQGNYERFTITPTIKRTRDLERWETLATTSNLPQRVFYGAVAFRGRLWMMGGYDGRRYSNEVWNSPDGVRWTTVSRSAPWSARTIETLVVFRDRLWLIGGGVIDGQVNPNPNSSREVWSTVDGVQWRRHADRTGPLHGGTPIVFDDRLWLIGVNRAGAFAPATLVTADGDHWEEHGAPWPARGGAAVWVLGDRLLMTGGKYSEGSGEAIRFAYRNDVWALERTGKR